MTHTSTAPTTSWDGKHGNLTLMLEPLKSELRLKKLVSISIRTGTRSSPAVMSSVECRYIPSLSLFLCVGVCVYIYIVVRKPEKQTK